MTCFLKKKSGGHLSRKKLGYGTGWGRHLTVETDFFLQGVKIHILDFTKQKRDFKYLNSFKNYRISRFLSINMTHPLNIKRLNILF
jgi:hypothetical protein